MGKKRKCISFFVVIFLFYYCARKPKRRRLFIQVSKYVPCVQPSLNYPTDLNISIRLQSSWRSVQSSGKHLQPGGKYKPKNCKANESVALIIPYRDRENNLKVFLSHMHPFLQRQQLQYGLFVIEMQTGQAFNRGTLMNIGFTEACRQSDYNCFIFHDVDLLPLREELHYTCDQHPKHFSVAIDLYNYQLPYLTYFGGVNAFTKQQFKQINGFANVYKGWGREDDDLYLRTRNANFTISRPAVRVGRFRSLGHKKAKIRKEK